MNEIPVLAITLDGAGITAIRTLVRNVFALLISGALRWVPPANGLSWLVEPIVAPVHEKGRQVGDTVILTTRGQR